MKTLIITDIQNDFLPNGALAVKNSAEIIHLINALLPHFEHVIATQDWHPPNHVSFASTFEKKIGDTIEINGYKQTLWPEHCIQNSPGAALSPSLNKDRIEHFVLKGTDPEIDSYSVFFDNVHLRSTGLEQYLRDHKLNDLYFVGLTTDYCIRYSVLDALTLGFKVSVIKDCCRPVNLHPGDEAAALAEMERNGATMLLSSSILEK